MLNLTLMKIIIQVIFFKKKKTIILNLNYYFKQNILLISNLNLNLYYEYIFL